MLHHQENPKLTPVKSMDIFSMVGLRFSTTFNPSWKKLDRESIWGKKKNLTMTHFNHEESRELDAFFFVSFNFCEKHTCTGHENIWWGSAPSRPPSWFWFHSLWWDTERKNSCQSLDQSLPQLAERWITSLTSHIWSWKARLSFSISSAISPPLISVLIIPCSLACSRFSFSILLLHRRGRTPSYNTSFFLSVKIQFLGNLNEDYFYVYISI